LRVSTAGVLVLLTCAPIVLCPGQTSTSRPPLRTFAAVYMVRGSVVGRSTGDFGLFVRNGADTNWTRLNRSNMYTYGLGYFERGAVSRYYIAAGNGVHRSTDGGKHWRILTSWRTREILSVVPDPQDSAVVYAATPEWIYKTTDDGLSWVPKKNGLRHWFVLKLIMDDRRRNVLYAAGEDDLYRTSDGGEQWLPLGTGASQIQAVYQKSVRGDLLLCAPEDSGVLVSTDGGGRWRRGAGLESATLYALTGSPGGEELFAAGWETGIWHSTDAGAHWSRLSTEPAVEAIFTLCVDPRNSEHLLAGTDGQGIYESFDRGRTWRRGGMMGAKVKDIALYP
jgi:photosystem II stability/assembly factor-like uncharacterized protein